MASWPPSLSQPAPSLEDPCDTGRLQIGAPGKGTCVLWTQRLWVLGPQQGTQDLLGPTGGCGDYVPCIYHPVPGRHGCHSVQVKQCLPLGLGESLRPVPLTLPPHQSCAPALIARSLPGFTDCQPHRVGGEPCLDPHPLQGLCGPGPGPNKMG